MEDDINWQRPGEKAERPPRKKSKLPRYLLIATLILLAMYGCGTILASVDTSTTTTLEAPDKDDTSAFSNVGNRDGKFQFAITKVQTKSSVGTDFMKETAQGKFIIVSLTVTNIGKESQLFDAGSQSLVAQDETTYSSNTGATLTMPNANSFLEEINPGNTIKGILVFDVPKDVNPGWIELHDSMFSGGTLMELKR